MNFIWYDLQYNDLYNILFDQNLMTYLTSVMTYMRISGRLLTLFRLWYQQYCLPILRWKSVSIHRIHKWVVSTWNIPENTSNDHCLIEFRVFEKLKNTMFPKPFNFVRIVQNSYGFIFEWAKISLYSCCIEFVMI